MTGMEACPSCAVELQQERCANWGGAPNSAPHCICCKKCPADVYVSCNSTTALKNPGYQEISGTYKHVKTFQLLISSLAAIDTLSSAALVDQPNTGVNESNCISLNFATLQEQPFVVWQCAVPALPD